MDGVSIPTKARKHSRRQNLGNVECLSDARETTQGLAVESRHGRRIVLYAAVETCESVDLIIKITAAILGHSPVAAPPLIALISL